MFFLYLLQCPFKSRFFSNFQVFLLNFRKYHKMNQRPFLIKFSDTSGNKTMGRVLTFRIFPFVMNYEFCKQGEGTFQSCRFITNLAVKQELWFSFPLNLFQLSDENLVKIVFFFSGNLSPNTGDGFFYNLLKVEFKLYIVISLLEMLKLGYKSFIVITQFAATMLFWFLSK